MTQDTTHRATQENGPNVVNRQLVWTSATGITAADHNSYAGCTRRWFYDQVLEMKAPPTAAMLGGTELHTEIENHLRHGERLTSPLALSGRAFIPQPGGSLQIEKPIHFKTRFNVDIFGHVDLYNYRQEYIDEEGVLQRDPSWSFEVKDWKTTSDFQYAKTAAELAQNIQLVTYAEAGFRASPDLEHGRMTHVYFRTKGRPESKLVTIRRTRAQIAERWEYAESVVRIMSDAARETNVEKIPGNRASCDAYRGCPHRTKCSIYTFNALDHLYGKIADDHVQEKQTMGLIAQTQPQLMQQGTPQQQPMQQQLAQEEAQMRAQVAQQQQLMPQQFNAAEFLQVCYRLNNYGFGMPSLAGNAAQAYALAGGQSVAPGHVYPGCIAPPGASVSLHQMVLSEVAQVYQIEREAAAKAGVAAAPMLPPAQAAPSGPATFDVVKASQGQNPWGHLPPQAAPSFLAPGTPESMPNLAQAAALPPVRGPNDSEPPEKAKRKGRPAKIDSGSAPEAQAATQAAPPPLAASVPQAPSGAAPTYPAGIMANGAVPTTSGAALDTQVPPQRAEIEAAWGCVLINARFASKATKSLAGYVDYVNAALAQKYSVTADNKPGIQDVRCVPKDSVLAFGGWKGAVREVVKADPPPEGLYHLDTFMDELNEVVADALRVVANQRGWMYIRAVRG